MSFKREVIVLFSLVLLVTGCTEPVTTDGKGNKKKEFSIIETAIVNDTKIKINSVKKILRECSWEYDGKCQGYTDPDHDLFLVIDVTIENTGTEQLDISSMLSFELKTTAGEKGEYSFMLNAVKIGLDGSIKTVY